MPVRTSPGNQARGGNLLESRQLERSVRAGGEGHDARHGVEVQRAVDVGEGGTDMIAVFIDEFRGQTLRIDD